MAKRKMLAETAELVITVEADKQEWLDAQKKAKNKLLKSVQIPGFRKGKVPLAKAESLISEGQVIQEAANSIAPKLASLAKEQIIESDKVLDEALLNPVKVSKEELVIEFKYPVYPEFKISNYKGLDISYEAPTVSKEEIDSEVDKIIKSHSLLISSDKAIENGDVVLFDFKGFIDDEPFEGGETEDFELKIGSGNFIKGFEESMIGFVKGDKKEIKVTFPKDYHAKNFAGKPAIFKIHVKDVKKYEKVKLDDAFVSDLKIENVYTVAQLREYLKKLLLEEKTEKSKIDFQHKVFHKIFENTTIPLASVLINKEKMAVQRKTEERLKEQGFSLKEYADLLKLDTKTLNDTFEKEAIHNLKTSLIFAEISRIEKLEATEEDYKKEYEKFAKLYKTTPEAVEQMVSKFQLQIPIINRKVIDRLIEYNSGKIGQKMKTIVSKVKKEENKEIKTSKPKTSVKKPVSKTTKKETKKSSSK
ncbi:trigger factor [Mycoplasma sp. 1012]